jgi:plastocyanin
MLAERFVQYSPVCRRDLATHHEPSALANESRRWDFLARPPRYSLDHSKDRTMQISRTTKYIAAACAAAVAAGCGGSGYGGGPTAPPNDPRTVSATPSLAFTPSTLTIETGQTVTFAFGSVAHDLFFDANADAPADIPGTNANVSITRTFAHAGTYRYTCHIHPTMHGTIVVQ